MCKKLKSLGNTLTEIVISKRNPIDTESWQTNHNQEKTYKTPMSISKKSEWRTYKQAGLLTSWVSFCLAKQPVLIYLQCKEITA